LCPGRCSDADEGEAAGEVAPPEGEKGGRGAHGARAAVEAEAPTADPEEQCSVIKIQETVESKCARRAFDNP
jgi:hypothetical protein